MMDTIEMTSIGLTLVPMLGPKSTWNKTGTECGLRVVTAHLPQSTRTWCSSLVVTTVQDNSMTSIAVTLIPDYNKYIKNNMSDSTTKVTDFLALNRSLLDCYASIMPQEYKLMDAPMQKDFCFEEQLTKGKISARDFFSAANAQWLQPYTMLLKLPPFDHWRHPSLLWPRTDEVPTHSGSWWSSSLPI